MAGFSGGSWAETTGAPINANAYGLMKVDTSFGIDFEHRGKFLEENVYTYEGQKISRDEAWQIIKNKLGK